MGRADEGFSLSIFPLLAGSVMGSSSVALVTGDETTSVAEEEGERGNVRGELPPLTIDDVVEGRSRSSSVNLLLVGVSYCCWDTAIVGSPLVTASLFF